MFVYGGQDSFRHGDAKAERADTVVGPIHLGDGVGRRPAGEDQRRRPGRRRRGVGVRGVPPPGRRRARRVARPDDAGRSPVLGGAGTGPQRPDHPVPEERGHARRTREVAATSTGGRPSVRGRAKRALRQVVEGSAEKLGELLLPRRLTPTPTRMPTMRTTSSTSPPVWRLAAVRSLGLVGDDRIAGVVTGAAYPHALTPIVEASRRGARRRVRRRRRPRGSVAVDQELARLLGPAGGGVTRRRTPVGERRGGVRAVPRSGRRAGGGDGAADRCRALRCGDAPGRRVARR